MNTRTGHVVTPSHVNDLTRLPCRYAHKKIDFRERVRSHCSYLANTVEVCFYNTLDFFSFNTLSSFVSLTRLLILYNPAYFVTSVCQLFNCRMVFVKYIAYRI